MPSLSISDLSIRFGGIKALSGVTFDVPPNSFVGLMGPNGAGKTTVVNCISRICSPQEGKISFDGNDLLKLSGHEIVEIGISRTFQDLNFFSRIPDMLVIDYLKLGQLGANRFPFLGDGLQMKRSRAWELQLKGRARRILEFFRDIRDQLEPAQEERGYPYLYGREGFPDLLDLEFKPISSLSFAWRRRLDLARALVSNPKLLLLDEPAQGLPPSEIENLGKTLKIIQTDLGVSALIIEHNVTTLAQISSRIVAMNYGEKIAEGAPEEVTKDPNVIEIYLGGASSKRHLDVEVAKSASKGGAKDTPVLEMRNVDHYYGFAQALYSVSLKIKPKQISSVLGTNGSGKSTLLKVISGMERPTFGEILFKGAPLPLGWPEAAVERGVQYVPQGHVVFPELSVRDNLKIGSYIARKNGISFKESLEKVFHYFPDLKKHLDVQAASLSGGQQQMLAIGQAIMGRPELLLLDEPSLGLSPMLVAHLFETIERIGKEEGCAIILVEQDVNRALEVSDYVYMMNSGVLIAEGTRNQLDAAVVQRHLGFN